MIRYSDIVRSIKSMSKNDLISYLRKNNIISVEGSTRIVFFLDHFIIKIASRYSEHHNRQEYQHYLDYKTERSPVPVVYTRLYKTLDGYSILIQERLLRVLELVLDNTDEQKCEKLYTGVENLDTREDYIMLSEKYNIPIEAFNDGAQAGYNKQNKFVFFDYSRVW